MQQSSTNKLFLCHLPMFNMPVHSYQVILQADLPDKDMKTYIKTKNENPNKPIIISNTEEKTLKMLSNAGSFKAQITFADDDGNSTDDIVDSTSVRVNKTLLFEKLTLTKNILKNSHIIYMDLNPNIIFLI